MFDQKTIKALSADIVYLVEHNGGNFNGLALEAVRAKLTSFLAEMKPEPVHPVSEAAIDATFVEPPKVVPAKPTRKKPTA